MKTKNEYDSTFSIAYDILAKQDSFIGSIQNISDKCTLTLLEIKDLVENKNFVTEVIREIEKPVIVEKQIVKEIEKPIITEKVVVVEKPVIIEKEVVREIEKPIVTQCGCNCKPNTTKPNTDTHNNTTTNNNNKPIPTEYIKVKPNTTDEYIRSRVCKRILIKNPEYRFRPTTKKVNGRKIIKFENPHNPIENRIIIKHCS